MPRLVFFFVFFLHMLLVSTVVSDDDIIGFISSIPIINATEARRSPQDPIVDFPC